MTFALPAQPADEQLYNEAIEAALDFQAGLITEDAFDLAQQRYLAAEREHFERAWQAA
jgi:hypothetical protein